MSFPHTTLCTHRSPPILKPPGSLQVRRASLVPAQLGPTPQHIYYATVDANDASWLHALTVHILAG